MLFNSFEYALFFISLYALYLISQRQLRLQNTLLLVGSYFFYGSWDWRFLGLILLSTVIDYTCGWALDRRQINSADDAREDEHQYVYSARTRKTILFVSIAANLGILGFFKYFDFFATSAAELLSAIGLPLEPRLLNLILPVGISFYTFQTLSYTIDIYRGGLRAQSSFLEFAVYVAFFPQLVAGPIVRAKDFLPQITRPRRIAAEQFYEGGYLILWGLFKKVVIADNLAVLVDGVFSAETLPHGTAVLVALYAFAVQIYCDFSGYSDIARGCAKIMGFEICLNFNLPYFAGNPSEFWRRWHISLSSWLRDFLYIPLGGNRKGPRRTCINLMLTMVLGGLWHGAAWTFALWGLFQGALLMIHRAVMPWLEWLNSSRSRATRAIYRWVAIMIFFQFVCLGWLIFRAESLQQIADMLKAMFSSFSLKGSGITILVSYSLPLLLMQLIQYTKNDLNIVLRWPAPVRGLVYTCMFYGLVIYGAQVESPFIYFQF